MIEKETSQAILVQSERCHGCLTCQLRCSLRACGSFNPLEARIRIHRVGTEYGYCPNFTDGCDGCGGDYLCVQWCPYGTLQLRGKPE